MFSLYFRRYFTGPNVCLLEFNLKTVFVYVYMFILLDYKIKSIFLKHLSTLTKEFSVAACIMQSSSNNSVRTKIFQL